MQQKPAYIATVQAHDAGLSERVTDVRDFVLKEGALSPKVKTLMMMLCDALLAQPNGVRSISTRARAMGATQEEINETIQVAFLMGGLPALVTGCNAYEC